MTADRSKDAGINRPAPDHPVGLRSRHCGACRLLVTEGLKERRIGLKTCFFQILDHVILGLVMNRYLVLFSALFQEPEPASATVFIKVTDPHPEHSRNPRKGKQHDAD